MKSMKRKILQIIGFSAVTALFTAGCDGCGGGGGGNGVSPTAATYTVTYNVNGAFDDKGAAVKSPDSQTVESGAVITLDSIGGEEYPFIFKYWTEGQTDTAGPESRHIAGKPYQVTKDITLYAQWDSAYAVVFDANGATSGTAPTRQKKAVGGTHTLPDSGGLAKAGYAFFGWDTQRGGSASVYRAGGGYPVERDDTLYAQWVAKPEFIDAGGMFAAAGGTFTMGESGDTVTVAPFKIAIHEVTQKLWRDVTGKNPSYDKGDSLPVTNVSWDDVQEFLDTLEIKTGTRYRLPTEAEWEYAARGGENYIYSGSDTASSVAVYYDSVSVSKPANVGSKNANKLGLYDMSGNVWEWVEDASDIDPNEAGRRIIRGGSWDEPAENCTVSRRQDWGQSSGVRKDLGFRLAVDQ